VVYISNHDVLPGENSTDDLSLRWSGPVRIPPSRPALVIKKVRSSLDRTLARHDGV
jgi:hypothetical protein